MYLTKVFVIFLIGLAHSQVNGDVNFLSFVEKNFGNCIDHSNGQPDFVQCQKQSSLLGIPQEIQPIIDLLFYPPLMYNGKKYLISKFPHRNVARAQQICIVFGGYLAEIDDFDEYRALQNFVLRSPVKNLVIIAGSDAEEEGTWILPRTGLRLKALDWVQNQPDNWRGEENCLSLWKPFGAKMNDETCGLLSSDNRFMCEIQN